MYIHIVGQLCGQQICNCSYIKDYHESLYISCSDSANDCMWFHSLNNRLVPIEEKFLTNNRNVIKLLGYYDNESYGRFIAINSSNHSCHYSVVPPLGGM